MGDQPVKKVDENTAFYRVESGSRWLDEVYQKWYQYMDIDKIDVASIDWCVMGQLSEGGWYESLRRFGIENMGNSFYIKMGFLSDSLVGSSELNFEWRAAVRKRRDEHKDNPMEVFY